MINREKALKNLVDAAKYVCTTDNGTAFSTLNTAIKNLRKAGDDWDKSIKSHTHIHNKSGKPYTFIAVAKNEANISDVVVYSDPDGQFWVRPLREFEEKFSPVAPPGIVDLRKTVVEDVKAFQWKGYSKEVDALENWLGGGYEVTVSAWSDFKDMAGIPLYKAVVVSKDNSYTLHINDWIIARADGSFDFLKDTELVDSGWKKP